VDFFPLTQLFEDLSDFCLELSVDYLPAVFGGEYDVVLAIPFSVGARLPVSFIL